MLLDILSLNPLGVTKLMGTLKRQLKEQKQAEIANLALPENFCPTIAKVVFLQIGLSLHIYITSPLEYYGSSAVWREILTRPQTENLNLVGVVDGDITTALRAFRELLMEAVMPLT